MASQCLLSRRRLSPQSPCPLWGSREGPPWGEGEEVGPLCCAETAVMGGTWRWEAIISPFARGGRRVRTHSQQFWGAGEAGSAQCGVQSLDPPWAVEKQAVPGWDLALFLGAESPHVPAVGAQSCAKLPPLTVHAGTALHPQCHFGVYPQAISHPSSLIPRNSNHPSRPDPASLLSRSPEPVLSRRVKFADKHKHFFPCPQRC